MKKRYVIRSVFSSLRGKGYELRRKRWFGYQFVDSAWLKYDKDAVNTLRATIAHLTEQPK